MCFIQVLNDTYPCILLITRRFPRPQNKSVTPHREKQVKRPIVRSVQYLALKGPLIPLQTEPSSREKTEPPH